MKRAEREAVAGPLFDDDGRPLQARFDLEVTPAGVDLVLAAQGGTSETREAQNPDYIVAFKLLLRRLRDADFTLHDALVDSSRTRHLSPDERRIHVPGGYPLAMIGVSDTDALRRDIRRQVSDIGKAPGAKGGNGNKKVRLRLSGPLGPAVLEARLRGLSRSGRARSRETGVTAPGGRQRSGSGAGAAARQRSWSQAPPEVKERVSRFVERGTNGDRVKVANGWCCQVCNAQGAPWVGFVKPDGTRYVEAHHVVLVSTLEDDVLDPRNIITVCPNHHRQIHSGGADVVDLGEAFGIRFPGAVQLKVRKFGPESV